MVLKRVLAASVVLVVAGCGGTSADDATDPIETSTASSPSTTGAVSETPGEAQTFIDIVRAEEALAPGAVFTTEMSDSELVAMALEVCDLAVEMGVVEALNQTESDLDAAGWGSSADQSLLSTMYGAATVTVCLLPGG